MKVLFFEPTITQQYAWVSKKTDAKPFSPESVKKALEKFQCNKKLKDSIVYVQSVLKNKLAVKVIANMANMDSHQPNGHYAASEPIPNNPEPVYDDDNEDICYKCKKGGFLILCDRFVILFKYILL